MASKWIRLGLMRSEDNRLAVCRLYHLATTSTDWYTLPRINKKINSPGFPMNFPEFPTDRQPLRRIPDNKCVGLSVTWEVMTWCEIKEAQTWKCKLPVCRKRQVTILARSLWPTLGSVSSVSTGTVGPLEWDPVPFWNTFRTSGGTKNRMNRELCPISFKQVFGIGADSYLNQIRVIP